MTTTRITDAILLRSVPYKESDVILSFYTSQYGRVSAYARGARNSRRRFCGGLTLLTIGKAEMHTSKPDSLWKLSDYDVSADHTNIASNLDAMIHASYAIEIVRELTPLEHPDKLIFDLLVEFFESLSVHGAVFSILRSFELRFLSYSGFAPTFDRCVQCDKLITTECDVLFDITAGGIVCCSDTQNGLLLSEVARQFLISVQQKRSFSEVNEIPMSHRSKEGSLCRQIMLSIIQQHIGKPLRSVEFIHKMTSKSEDSLHRSHG